jgi:hypothetical protein
VRALRAEWFAQRFLPGLAVDGEPFRIEEAELSSRDEQLVGFGVTEATATETPGALAGAALALETHFDWDPASLTRPVYLAPPPTHRKQTPSPSGP